MPWPASSDVSRPDPEPLPQTAQRGQEAGSSFSSLSFTHFLFQHGSVLYRLTQITTSLQTLLLVGAVSFVRLVKCLVQTPDIFTGV